MPEIVLILIRSVASFIVLLILARIMGKQQLSQLTFFDYIVGITIGSIAAAMSMDQNIKIANGFVALIVWGLFPIALAIVSMKSRRFSKLTDGKPTVLVKNGKIQEQNLKKQKMPVDELMPMLRGKNAFKLSDVELAVMEINGEVSVMKKSDTQPVTPKILGMQIEEEHQPQIVVIDGQVIEESLNKTGYTQEWLLGEARKQGADSFKDVFLAQIDSKGNVYIDLNADQMKAPEVKQRPLVNASLKKVQGDLESFALQTEDKKAKKAYQQESENLQKMIDQLQPYLKE